MDPVAPSASPATNILLQESSPSTGELPANASVGASKDGADDRGRKRTIAGRGPIRSKAFVLYEGSQTPHRSCGIALAETFGRSTLAYQSLRRGGITGKGQCGAIVAGQLILGEILGDQDPTGKVLPELRDAVERYQARIENELDRGSSPDLICNNMTAPHGPFLGEVRHRFCTNVVAQVAQTVDELLRAAGVVVEATPVELLNGKSFEPQSTPFVPSSDEVAGSEGS
jgi:hypothetical protein